MIQITFEHNSPLIQLSDEFPEAIRRFKKDLSANDPKEPPTFEFFDHSDGGLKRHARHFRDILPAVIDLFYFVFFNIAGETQQNGRDTMLG